MANFSLYLSIFALAFSIYSLIFAIKVMRQHKREYYRRQGWPDPYE